MGGGDHRHIVRKSQGTHTRLLWVTLAIPGRRAHGVSSIRVCPGDMLQEGLQPQNKLDGAKCFALRYTPLPVEDARQSCRRKHLGSACAVKCPQEFHGPRCDARAPVGILQRPRLYGIKSTADVIRATADGELALRCVLQG